MLLPSLKVLINLSKEGIMASSRSQFVDYNNKIQKIDPRKGGRRYLIGGAYSPDIDLCSLAAGIKKDSKIIIIETVAISN